VDSELERIEAQTFGPSDTVVLDGKSFILCLFDRCELVYGGGHMTHEDCTFSFCRVTFVGPAWRTVELLAEFGFTITSPSGENPKTQFFQ
jgi:hypothetical protein